MSFRPNLNETCLNPTNKTSSRLRLPSKIRLEKVKNPSITSVTNSQVSKFPFKVLTLPQEGTSTSRNKLGLYSTRTSKKINLSMNSPSNHILHTTRHGKGNESFSFFNQHQIKFPLTSELALGYLKESLSDIEKFEILEYKLIYYAGKNINKIVANPNLPNWGFDCENGDYKTTPGDHLDYRYEVISMLGKGSFGQVFKCFDHKNKGTVALKIVKNKKKFHKQGAVEVKLLKKLAEQDPNDCFNIVQMKTHFLFRNHLCLVFELLSMSLYDLLKLHKFQGLPLHVVSRIAIQILVALQFSASLQIIHCDLKPENILLKSANKCGVKIIDFGSGCYENEKIYTYIQSRFYRAPEIMLGISYTGAIDMWSFACILVELYVGYPIFPGESESEQFFRIMEVLGLPGDEILLESTRKNVFFDSNGKPRISTNSRGKIRLPGRRTVEDYIGKDQPLFASFLKEILQWAPDLRPSPSEALSHPWIQSTTNPIALSRKRRILKSFIDISEYTDNVNN